ncbi:methylenetetrahydrofolate reductase C-terminal domain-containing protein [Paraburkholderia phenoliruptrix]|uniref:methylenetetrahydrofolate reductase C-terminal domain-containing protein n=1 Tax=Paraburkholderia phenoliruptrix TaxID=252970 RepID=UPI0011D1AA00
MALLRLEGRTEWVEAVGQCWLARQGRECCRQLCQRAVQVGGCDGTGQITALRAVKPCAWVLLAEHADHDVS